MFFEWHGLFKTLRTSTFLNIRLSIESFLAHVRLYVWAGRVVSGAVCAMSFSLQPMIRLFAEGILLHMAWVYHAM